MLHYLHFETTRNNVSKILLCKIQTTINVNIKDIYKILVICVYYSPIISIIENNDEPFHIKRNAEYLKISLTKQKKGS